MLSAATAAALLLLPSAPARAPRSCSMSGLACLEGGASASRVSSGAAGRRRGIAEFLSSSESDAWLLNTAAYVKLLDGSYECTMATIPMLAVSVVPRLVVRIDRPVRASHLIIRVLSARVSLQTAGSEPWYLEGADIESSNTVSWAPQEPPSGAGGEGEEGEEGEGEGEAGSSERATAADAAHGGAVRLGTDLQLRVNLQLPKRLPLSRAAVERPGSAILKSVCRRQCGQFLAEIEQGYYAWRDGEQVPSAEPPPRVGFV